MAAKRPWQGSSATVSKHFKSEIEPKISMKPFWFPKLDVPVTFRDAFVVANTTLADDDSENAVYHARFRAAWAQAFPDHCQAHPEAQISGGRMCAECVTLRQERPVYHYAADSSPAGFESERPDFLVFREVVAEMNGLGCDGVVEMKIIKDRAATFKPADISQAVRFGYLVLDSQPLRDQVTICLCTLQRVQFVRVFRNIPDIHVTPSSVVVGAIRFQAGEGLQQLYSYLLATHAEHGQRRIGIQGWRFTAVPPRVLGAGSFSVVLQMTDGRGERAALKLYQRTPDEAGLLDSKHITDELAILNLLNATTASTHVPQIFAHDATLQYILLTPVGERLSEQHVDRDLIIGLVAAVRAVHTHCIHRDLRAANILVVPGNPRSIKIIDWNLGLPVEDLARPHKPEGAVSVQGFGVLEAMIVGAFHRYSIKDDLVCLVRAVYLLFTPGPTSAMQGATPVEEILNWRRYWQRRLQPRAPPVGPLESMWYWWMTAEACSCAGDYDGLQDALLRVL